MSNLGKKLEIVANVGIIAVSILLVVFIVQRTFFGSAPTAEPAAQPRVPAVGAKIELADYNFSPQEKTVLLVLSESCKYCTESAPFYRQLVERAKTTDTKVIAAFPAEKEKSQKYLSTLGLSEIEVRQSSLDKLQVRGTPTLLLINKQGEITQAWVGKLPPEKETEVFNQL